MKIGKTTIGEVLTWIFLILSIIFIVAFFGILKGIMITQEEAIKAGVAKYIQVDSKSPKTQFVWINGTNTIPFRVLGIK